MNRTVTTKLPKKYNKLYQQTHKLMKQITNIKNHKKNNLNNK